MHAMDRKRKNRMKTEVEIATLEEAFRQNEKLQWHLDRGLKDSLKNLDLPQIRNWWSNHKTAEKRRASTSSTLTATTNRARSTSSLPVSRQPAMLLHFQDQCRDPQIEQLHGLLKSKDEEIAHLKEETDYKDDTVNALVKTSREAKDELQQARTALIKGLRCLPVGLFDFGVKMMGQLDANKFLAAFDQISRTSEREYQAAILCSTWDGYMRDPSWKPFKTEGQEVTIDKGDYRLRRLKTCYGDQLYRHVANTLLEMNEYNPSGRYPTPELWNYKEDRKAKLFEVSTFPLKLWKQSLRERRGINDGRRN